VEYFLWLRRGAAMISDTAIDEAIAKGPQK
jgi:hypothetical protein